MKLTGHVPKIAVILSLLMLFLTLSVVSPGHWQRFSAVNVAFAANGDNGEEEEPFAKEQHVASDPWESMNRKLFDFNDKLYFWVLKPVAKVYSAFIPEGFRICLRNAFHNVEFPIRFFNNAFQGKLERAGVEFGRFAINSTLGMAGFFEIASRDFNLDPYKEDFGQTLGYYGSGPGVYIVWPFFGPSNVRDTFGLIGDVALNPLTYVSLVDPEFYVTPSIKVGRVINSTSLRIGEYEDTKRSALDPYISIRDAYLQHRAEEIKK